MPEIRFTDAKIASLKTSRTREEYRDPRYPNLVLRVTRTGNKSFLYRLPRTESGRRPGKTLGRYPRLSLRNALKLYSVEVTRVECGEPEPDLNRRIRELEAELATLKRRVGNVVTFDVLAKEYLERYAKRNNRSWKHQEYLLRRDPMRVWHGKPVEEIRKRDVARLIDEVVQRAPVLANRLLALLHRVWNWAVSQDLVEFNPCSGIEKPTKEHRRERVLDDREIALFWAACQGKSNHIEPCIDPVLGDAVCFALATAQRRSEVAFMEWHEVEKPSLSWWRLDQERTKAARPHRVYLSTMAQAILCRRREACIVNPTFVFPSSRRESKAIRPSSISQAFKRIGDKLLEKDLITERATVHDLRSTATTRMAQLGVDRRVLRRILNHSDSSVTARYDLYQYDREVEEALTAWSFHVEEVLRQFLPAC